MNYILIVIGISLFGLSLILILLGSFYSKKRTSKSSQGYNKKEINEYSIIPLRLKYNSKIKGKISVSKGDLQFSLEDYFGWIPQPPIEWVAPAYVRWSGHGKHDFEVKLKSGDYMIMLISKAQVVSAKIEYTVTYYIESLRQLVDLGLVFVEVSVPLLVTGLVI